MCNYCLFYFFVFYCIVYCIVTRHSLVRAKGEVLVLLYVFLFVWSTISQQPAGRFKPSFACWRILVLNVSSPLLGVSGPRRTEKVGNEIFVTMGVNGEFLHFGDFWAISQQRADASTPNFICVWTMSADVPPSPLGSIGSWGGGGELKTQKMGGGLIRAADSYHFYFSQRCQMWFSM